MYQMAGWQKFGDGFSSSKQQGVTTSTRKSNLLENSFKPSSKGSPIFGTNTKHKKKILKLHETIKGKDVRRQEHSITKTIRVKESRFPNERGTGWNTSELQAAFAIGARKDETVCSSDDNENINWSDSSSEEEVLPTANYPCSSDGVNAKKRKFFASGSLRHFSRNVRSKCPLKEKKMSHAVTDTGERNIIHTDIFIKKEVDSNQIDAEVENSRNSTGARKALWAGSSFQNMDIQKVIDSTRKRNRRCSCKKTNTHNVSEQLGNIGSEEDDSIDDEDSSTSENPEEEEKNEIEVDNEDFPADAERSPNHKLFDSISAAKPHSPLIDPSSPSRSGPDDKMTASAWARAVQKHQTPSKASPTCEEQHLGVDSAKKKRKYSKGSLASCLFALIKREKSSVRFWFHNIKNPIYNDKSSRFKTVQILTIRRQYSVYVAMCCDVDRSSVEGAAASPVLFQRDTVDRLALKPGVSVNIFPPWQQLDEAGGKQTILCTQYVTLATGQSDQPKETREDVSSVIVKATWSCPCCRDPHIKASLCSASLHPQVICPQAKITCQSSDPSKLQGVCLHPVNLLSSQYRPSGDASQVKRTLLDSMESPLPGLGWLSPFSATVLRVFEPRESDSEESVYQVLLEDSVGTLAIVSVEPPETPLQEAALWRLEGTTCRCAGLCLGGRATRDREPGLFSVVSVAWSQRGRDATSQESQSLPHTVQMKAPSFCYLLQFAEGAPPVLEEIASESQLAVLQPYIAWSAQDVRKAENSSRVSILAKVIVSKPKPFAKIQGSPDMFVLLPGNDGSTKVTECKRLEFGGGHILGSSVEQSGLYFLRDLIVDQGGLVCDRYSTLINEHLWEPRGINSKLDSSVVDAVTSLGICLPEVHWEACVGSLVRVEGCITSVDERRAFSWEECDQCGTSDLVHVTQESPLHCPRCEREVLDPVTQMAMEVVVDTPGHGGLLTVELCQRTIQSLLPPGESDEGYEVDTVVGQTLKCPVCLVLAAHSQNAHSGVSSGDQANSSLASSHHQQPSKDPPHTPAQILLRELDVAGLFS